MNKLAAILSFFFLSLAIVPCADAAITDNIAAELSTEHEHEGQADNCTPLCYCHCCHVHVTMNVETETLNIKELMFSQAIFYQEYNPDTPLNSLFRPPMI
jgi:hypothetical protein